ncbi:hypothetical protein [Halomonas sp. MCCC 1A11062]|uniref:hypothetical protein n=1 Tax=Halomonas sp. MCCC 1A11062 TaxID=2733485 RepID=UPI001F2798A9|nr:hypothetical protein [Halomonas sp. MCCC 1A11062]MCE8038500.1 hypothetical protein [Halomonas sp. MCCC 1A11062]
MLKRKTERHGGLKALNALCAMVLLLAGLYLLFAGYQLGVVVAMAFAAAGIAIPAAMGESGMLEILMAMFEALIEGFMVIVSAILKAISSLTG